MLQSIRCFHDVHAHAAAIGSWNLNYAQISSGKLQSSLTQLSTRRCHLFRERINKRVVQHGEAPKDQICFAFPVSAPGGAHVQGRQVDEECMLFLEGGDEFMCHMPIDMDLFAINFEQGFFQTYLQQIADPDHVARLLKQPVIKVRPEDLHTCRERLLNIFSLAVLPADGHGARSDEQDAEYEQALELSLLAEMMDLLATLDCTSFRPMSTIRSYIVDKLHRQTIADAINVPSIFEVCHRLKVSRRTVQNSFRTVAETTPLNYLRCVRLNGVRRELLASTIQESSIGDIASRWGFFHLSHFAEDYRALFGELPSQTARRPAHPIFQ